MVLVRYNGNTLVSLSYCERKIRELTAEYAIISLGPLADGEQQRKLQDEILSYKKIKEELEKVTVDEWIACVKAEMADKVKKARVSQKEIFYAYIDSCTIMLGVYNLFFTEITFNKTVYFVERVPNEYYDGDMDTLCDITVAKPTAFLSQFITKLENELNNPRTSQ